MPNLKRQQLRACMDCLFIIGMDSYQQCHPIVNLVHPGIYNGNTTQAQFIYKNAITVLYKIYKKQLDATVRMILHIYLWHNSSPYPSRCSLTCGRPSSYQLIFPPPYYICYSKTEEEQDHKNQYTDAPVIFTWYHGQNLSLATPNEQFKIISNGLYIVTDDKFI